MPNETDDLLIEITRVGAWLRVAVLDPLTGEEAVVHGPANAGEHQLVRLARQRLGRRRPDAGPGLVV